MNKKLLVSALAAFALPSFAFAQDSLMAGFTFSQFLGSGVPTINADTFETTNHIVATYRGNMVPDSAIVDGSVIVNSGGAGFDDPSIGTWSFSNFDINDGVGVTGESFGSLNTVNSTTLAGLSKELHVTDAAGMGLTFNTVNTLWSIQINDTASFTNASVADFTFAGRGNGGTATVEWLFDGQVFATSSITADGFNTYSYELDSAFYGNGLIEGRLTQGSVTFDNVQFNGSAIPEPSAYAAFAGLAGLALAVSRRRKSA